MIYITQELEMSRFWKWFLTIAGVLIVIGIAVLIPAVFMLSHRGFGMMRPFGGMPMMRGFVLFNMAGFFIRFLVPAIGIGLLVLLGFAIGKGSKPAVTPVPPAVQEPSVMAEPVCPSCGEPIQTDWKHCPHCGTSL
jgi:hypothetical protein